MKKNIFFKILLLLFLLSGTFLVPHIEAALHPFLLKIIPANSQYGVLFYQDLFQLISKEFLWCGLYIGITWIMYDAVELSYFSTSHFPETATKFWFPIILVFFLSVVAIAKYVLLNFPNSSDEYVYLFQASSLSKFRLFETAHPLPQFFTFNHLFTHQGEVIGRFPPGWPLILSLAYTLHIPPLLINPFISTLTIYVFFLFARLKYNQEVAVWSTLALATSSFYLFNSASYFSHSLALLCTLLFALFFLKFIRTGNFWLGLLAGFFIGLSFSTRYYTAILAALPFSFYLFAKRDFASWLKMAYVVLGFLPWLAFLLWYNYSTTGSVWMPVTVWADANEGLGFVKGHTLSQGIEHIVRRITMFVYWTSPGLILLFIYFLIKKVKLKNSLVKNPEDWMMVVFVIGYLFYHEIGGNQYGPRFYYEAFPFMIIFIIAGVLDEKRNKLLIAMCCAGIVYGLIKLPFIASRERKVILERIDLFTQVKSENIDHAVILVSSSTGIIRPMPVGDLIRNNKDFSNDVIYARDLGESNTELMKYYPDRKFYLYQRELNRPQGTLTRIH